MYSEAENIIQKWVPGTPLKLSNLNLVKLPNIPSGVEHLDVSNNKITHIHSLPRTIKILNCSNNKVRHIENLPVSIEKLNLGFNCLEQVNLKQYNNLKCISLIWNRLTEVPPLPLSAKVLFLSHNRIEVLKDIKAKLVELDMYNCGLKTIEKLPDTIQCFSCEGNYLKSLCYLPLSLTRLNCANNDLTALPALPIDLKILICNNNKLIFLPYIPSSLTLLNAEYNNILVNPIVPEQASVSLDYNPFSIKMANDERSKIPKQYKVIKSEDLITDVELGTAYDFFNLEDVNIKQYLIQNDKNIILVLGNQKYAVSRDDLIDYMNTTVFTHNIDSFFRTPWNQIIHYNTALKFLTLDVSIFELVETELKVSNNELEYRLYNINTYKYSKYDS